MTAIADQAQAPSVTRNEIEKRVHALADRCAKHNAVRNPFYDLWITEELDADDVALVVTNFLARTQRAPIRIALAFLHMTDITARTETVQNLHDEMGLGDPSKAHSVLLRDFMVKLLSRMRGREVDLNALNASVLPSTNRLIEDSEKIFSSSSPQVVCGALLAQEWHAYPQLVRLYEGFRNYRHFFGLEEFHENCEYFYLHIGATEKEHKVHSLSTAAKACNTLEDVDALEGGFTAYLDLLAENWNELYQTLRPASTK